MLHRTLRADLLLYFYELMTQHFNISLTNATYKRILNSNIQISDLKYFYVVFTSNVLTQYLVGISTTIDNYLVIGMLSNEIFSHNSIFQASRYSLDGKATFCQYLS